MKTLARPLTRVIRTTLFTVLAGLGLLSAFQSRLIYFPNRYAEAETRSFLNNGGERIDFTTSEGKQTAWLLRPGETREPERIWIVTAGNGSMALDFAALADQPELSRDAFVFFDYPGYGLCEGKPHPDSIRASLTALGPLIEERCELAAGSLASRGVVWGHSLGAAVALMAASEYGITRAVLLSPFTSTMAMTRVAFGVPLGFLLTHRYDNVARLDEMLQRGGKVWVVHGTMDEIIPVEMARELARQGGPPVKLHEVPAARHNTLMRDAFSTIAASMKEARAAAP